MRMRREREYVDMPIWSASQCCDFWRIARRIVFPPRQSSGVIVSFAYPNISICKVEVNSRCAVAHMLRYYHERKEKFYADERLRLVIC